MPGKHCSSSPLAQREAARIGRDLCRIRRVRRTIAALPPNLSPAKQETLRTFATMFHGFTNFAEEISLEVTAA